VLGVGVNVGKEAEHHCIEVDKDRKRLRWSSIGIGEEMTGRSAKADGKVKEARDEHGVEGFEQSLNSFRQT
jgi:hypothetical protein